MPWLCNLQRFEQRCTKVFGTIVSPPNDKTQIYQQGENEYSVTRSLELMIWQQASLKYLLYEGRSTYFSTAAALMKGSRAAAQF
jgi:hypothetical protein